jgi:hypothetical protein
MSLLDTEETVEQLYKFTDGDLSEFKKEFNEPKQDMHIDIDPPEDFNEEVEEGLKEEEPLTQSSRVVARGLTVAIDAPMSGLLGFFNNGETDPFRLTKYERKSVEDALTAYLKLTGNDIPPGMMLAITLISIYGGKTLTLFQLRKERKRNDDLKNELENTKKLLQEAKIKLEVKNENIEPTPTN